MLDFYTSIKKKEYEKNSHYTAKKNSKPSKHTYMIYAYNILTLNKQYLQITSFNLLISPNIQII